MSPLVCVLIGIQVLVAAGEGTPSKFLQKSASGCDCSWIAKDDCINQDSCAQSCRQQFGKSCGSSASGCDCSWIANDDCINQDSCAQSCRQQSGKSCGSSASGCDCSWIANDDCINQDSCAQSCRQQFGKSCGSSGSSGSSGSNPSTAACQASCDASYSSCERWCHISDSDSTGSYYTPEEEEALKGDIMVCSGRCSVTRGTCYGSC